MSSTTLTSEYVKVKDHPGLVRGENRAVLNVDMNGLHSYKTVKRKNEEIDAALRDINSLRTEMKSIKQMLEQIFNRQDGNKA